MQLFSRVFTQGSLWLFLLLLTAGGCAAHDGDCPQGFPGSEASACASDPTSDCIGDECGDGTDTSSARPTTGQTCTDSSNCFSGLCVHGICYSSRVAAGSNHTCVVLDSGDVRCWGDAFNGQTGHGNTDVIGDDEQARDTGDVDVGGPVIQIATGGTHTCALLDGGAIRCWGYGEHGRLGLVASAMIGDDEVPASVGEVDVGGRAVQVVAGGSHTCALMATGGVRCWGFGGSGRLGYAHTDNIGDDETPASMGNIHVGCRAVQIAAGGAHTCALLDTGAVRCWGYGEYGQLGHASTENVGDDEVPDWAGDIDLGGTAIQIAAGVFHTCALLDTGAVRCWGYAGHGELGHGGTENIGDDETPAAVADIALGDKVVKIVAAGMHTCALLDTGGVRCWGLGAGGQLGYGNTSNVYDPAAVGNVDMGGTVADLSTAISDHTCAILDTGALRCWGAARLGQLGHGNTDIIGDDETPADAGDVPYL